MTSSWEGNALRRQVTLAEAFLSLARKERELGRRSLLDVLNGETLLFSARSDAITAEAKAVVAAYRVLYTMGRLDVTVVR